MEAQRYSTLDGVRGVAALAIVLLHLERPSFHMPVATYTAVDLFFLMSGFVIAAAYDHRIRRDGVQDFVRARLIRLYPTYLAGLMVLPALFVLLFLKNGEWLARPADILRSLAAALVFLPSHVPPSVLWETKALFPLNVPAWSLMLELVVNLAYALFLPWLSRPVLVVIVLVSGAALVASGLRLDGIDLGWGWSTLWGGFARASFSFFLGVLIHRTKLPRPNLPPWLVLGAVILMFWAPPLLAVIVGYPLILLAATRPGGRPSRVMAAMGALSYPLYAIHYPLLHWTGRLLANRLPAWASIPTSVALLLLGAFLVLKLWDEPVRRWLTQRKPFSPCGRRWPPKEVG